MKTRAVPTLRPQTIIAAVYRTYEHSGFSMAGAVAFSFVVSLFPFCIFLGAVGSVVVGDPKIAAEAVAQLFQILPKRVAEGLAPEIGNIMGTARIDLLGLSGLITLFFATSAIETLRAALNGAYRVQETRPYLLCLALSMAFVLVSAISMLVLTWAVVVGPGIAAQFEPSLVKRLLDSSWLAIGTRYAMAGLVIATQLFAFHLWLAAGKRTISDVWPGVALSMVLWLASAGLYSRYLDLNDYTRFYAGLSQLMVAMIYFQVTAVVVILGAELNRGILELKKLRNSGAIQAAA
jgi:membrane protein